ncbi:MAG: hypothetical protein QOD99_1707 [Chthoniobacter sp.]|jgi:hypothetical protein|nr:hypothetical protein [Chthoniobacter sp.]
MKKAIFGFLACAALVATGFAGTATVSAGKGYKEYKQVEQPTCFSDTEIQADVFGAYAVTEGGQGGIIREHGFGGGVGVNYFFARYFGVGAEGTWLDAQPNGGGGARAVHSFGGNVFFRYPIDAICLAPYVYLGGDAMIDGEDWAEAHAGGGLEYRVIPNKLGVFVDGRFSYLGDRFGGNDLHFTMVRAGVRWVF